MTLKRGFLQIRGTLLGLLIIRIIYIYIYYFGVYMGVALFRETTKYFRLSFTALWQELYWVNVTKARGTGYVIHNLNPLKGGM